jgi:hypothetical protein
VPARAEPVSHGAPYDCGSDELARRAGVLQTLQTIPSIPTQTHGCDWSTPRAPVIWIWYTPPADGTIAVVATAGGDPVCVFVSPGPTCGVRATAAVRANGRYAIGAALAEGSQLAIVRSIDVSFS